MAGSRPRFPVACEGAVSPASRRQILAAGAALPLVSVASARSRAAATSSLLDGKVAVIYGAAGDIGSGVSRAFAREGAHVCLVGRTLEKLQVLQRDIEAAGGSAECARADALDRDAVTRQLDAL